MFSMQGFSAVNYGGNDIDAMAWCNFSRLDTYGSRKEIPTSILDQMDRRLLSPAFPDFFDPADNGKHIHHMAEYFVYTWYDFSVNK